MERESDKENIQIANIQPQGVTLVFASFLANFGLLLIINKRVYIDLEYFRISTCLINLLPQNQNVERFHLFHTEKITEK